MIRAYFTFKTSGTQINSESKDLEHISFGTSSKITSLSGLLLSGNTVNILGAWAWRKIE